MVSNNTSGKGINFDLNNYTGLIQNLSQYSCCFCGIAHFFGGPSVYFHQKALEYQKSDFLGERHIESIYATLVAWGMHRMGKTMTKMPDFERFRKSILDNKSKLEQLDNYDIRSISKDDLDKLLPELTNVCFALNGSRSKSKLVSSTKILSHILPDLVCPMDRNYTLEFFGVNLTNKSEDKEKEVFQAIMRKMWEFFQDSRTAGVKVGCVFAENYPKLFDSLIVAYLQKNKITNP